MYSIANLDAFLTSLSELGFLWTQDENGEKKVKELIDGFNQYDPGIKYEKYRMKSFRPKHGYYLPPLFQGNWTIIPSSYLFNNINSLTDYWTEKVRISARKFEAEKSPIDLIDLKETKSQVFELLVKENPGKLEVSAEVVRQAFSFITHETRGFRLTWIKGILKALYHNLKELKGKKWLDISTGWGDRLIAAALLGMDYTGFDPNSKLDFELQKLIKDLNNLGFKQKLQSFPLPFESSEAKKILDNTDSDMEGVEGGQFDLILSSPPFFKAEIYCQEATQSDQNYQQFNDWMTKFLFKAIAQAWRHLKPGGYMCLYVGDANSQKEGICEPMNLFIETFKNASYLGVLGIENDIGVIRPCWVWMKVEGESSTVWKPYVKRSLKNDYSQIFKNL